MTGFNDPYRRQRFTPSHHSNIFSGLVMVGIVAVALVVIVGLGFGVTGLFKQNTKSDCVVIEKDRTRDSDGNSDMRIYTENCGTLKVQDTLIGSVNYNSADTYAAIKVGSTYNFKVRGYRVGIFSMFPVILKATEV